MAVIAIAGSSSMSNTTGKLRRKGRLDVENVELKTQLAQEIQNLYLEYEEQIKGIGGMQGMILKMFLPAIPEIIQRLDNNPEAQAKIIEIAKRLADAGAEQPIQ